VKKSAALKGLKGLRHPGFFHRLFSRIEEIRLKADATGCAIRDIAGHPGCDTLWSGCSGPMFKLITTMRRGSATGLAAAWARYPTVDAARLGTATLLRDDRILRVMIVRNEIPPAFVEWAER